MLINYLYRDNYVHTDIISSIILVLPAMVANAAPVIFGAGRPIYVSLFGKNKTVRGFIAGIIGGLYTALLIHLLVINGFVSSSLSLSDWLFLGILQGLGAMAGDLIGSFAKRRMGLGEGEELIVIDQVGFLLVAILFSITITGLDSYDVLGLVLLAFVLHKGTNLIAFRLGMKDRGN